MPTTTDYDNQIRSLEQQIAGMQGRMLQGPSVYGLSMFDQSNARQIAEANAQTQAAINRLQSQLSSARQAQQQWRLDQDRAAAEANRQQALNLTEGFAQSVRDDPRYQAASQAAMAGAQGQGIGDQTVANAAKMAEQMAGGQFAGAGDQQAASQALMDSLAGRGQGAEAIRGAQAAAALGAQGQGVGSADAAAASRRMTELLSGGQQLNSDQAIAEYMQRMGSEQGGLRGEADLVLNDPYMQAALRQTQATAEGRGNLPFSEQLLQNIQGRFADRTATAESANRAQMAEQLAARGQSMSDPGAASAMNRLGTERQTQNLGNLRELMIQQALTNADAQNQASTQLANMRLAQLAQRNPYILGSAAFGQQAAGQQAQMRAQNAQSANEMSFGASNALASQGAQRNAQQSQSAQLLGSLGSQQQAQQQSAAGQLGALGAQRYGQQAQSVGQMAGIGGQQTAQQQSSAGLLGNLASSQYGAAWPGASTAAQIYGNTKNTNEVGEPWQQPSLPGQTQNWSNAGRQTRSDGWSPTGTTQTQWQNPLTRIGQTSGVRGFRNPQQR